MHETSPPRNKTATDGLIRATKSNINKKIQRYLWLLLHLTCLNTTSLQKQSLFYWLIKTADAKYSPLTKGCILEPGITLHKERTITMEREREWLGSALAHNFTNNWDLSTEHCSASKIIFCLIQHWQRSQRNAGPFNRKDRLVTAAIGGSLQVSNTGTVIDLSIQGLARNMCKVDPS